MSDTAPQWFVQAYKSGVKTEYQREGFLLRDATTRGHTKSAESVTFFVAEGGAAARRVRKGAGLPSNVVPMNNGRRRVKIDFEFFGASEYIERVHWQQMSESELQASQYDVAKALGRAHDDFIMAAVAAADFTGRSEGANNAAWDLGKALRMCARAQQSTHALWDGQWVCPVPTVVWNIMMTYEEFSNSDWVDDKSFTRATKSKHWNGVHWMLMPDGLFPDNGGGKEFFMWHPSAIVSEDNVDGGGDFGMWITWENEKTSTLVNTLMGVACGVREKEGVVRGIAKNDIADITIAA